MRGRSRIQKGLIITVLAVVAFWLGSLIYSLIGKAELAVSQAREVQSQYAALEARREGLERDLQALETPIGRDAAIRTAFGVARPGEEVIVVMPPATTTATTTSSWWERLWSWL